jgi:branched-subunit amino acid transport protein
VARVSPVWISVVSVGAATIALKAVGPVLLGQRPLPSWLAGPVSLLAPAVLAAFVVTEAVGGHRSIVADARLIGVGAGGIAIALRAPILVVVVVAAAAAAIARLVT